MTTKLKQKCPCKQGRKYYFLTFLKLFENLIHGSGWTKQKIRQKNKQWKKQNVKKKTA